MIINRTYETKKSFVDVAFFLPGRAKDLSAPLYINSTNIPPIVIINRIYETKKSFVAVAFPFLVGLRTYQHPCI